MAIQFDVLVLSEGLAVMTTIRQMILFENQMQIKSAVWGLHHYNIARLGLPDDSSLIHQSVEFNDSVAGAEPIIVFDVVGNNKLNLLVDIMSEFLNVTDFQNCTILKRLSPIEYVFSLQSYFFLFLR